MELEKSFQLLTSITPISDHKSTRKPRITKFTLRKKLEIHSFTNLDNCSNNKNKMDSVNSVHSDEINEATPVFGQNNQKSCKNVHIFKERNELIPQLNNKEKFDDFNTKLNLTYDTSDDSILTNDCSLGSEISNDFKLILTSDDSNNKQEQIGYDSNESISYIISNSQSDELIRNSDFDSLNDFQPREIKETLTSIIDDISRSNDGCAKNLTKHNAHIRISMFKLNDEYKKNEILVPETQENYYDENKVIPCITIEESDDENENIINEKQSQSCRFSVKNVINITVEQTDSDNEICKNSVRTSETESYQTALLCKAHLEKNQEYNVNSTKMNPFQHGSNCNMVNNEIEDLYNNSLELSNNDNCVESSVNDNLNISDCNLEPNSLNKSAENLLDELYGKSWRKCRDELLSKSDMKIKKKQVFPNYPYTERKPKGIEKFSAEDTLSRFSTFTPDFESTRSITSEQKMEKTNRKTKINKKLFHSENFSNNHEYHDNTESINSFEKKNEEARDTSIIDFPNSNLEYLATPKCSSEQVSINSNSNKSKNNTDKKKRKLYTPKEESKTSLILPDLTRYSYSYITNKKKNQGIEKSDGKKQTLGKHIIYKIPRKKKIHKFSQNDSDECSDAELKAQIFEEFGQKELKSTNNDDISNRKENAVKNQITDKKNKIYRKSKIITSDSSDSIQSDDNKENSNVKSIKKNKVHSKSKHVISNNISSSNSDISDVDYKPKTPAKLTSKSVTPKKLSFLASLSGGIATVQCHLEALKYKKKFKQLRDELSKKLFNLYNSTIFDYKIPEDTQIEWNARMTGTAGFCYCKRIIRKNSEVQRSCRIVLSSKVLDSPDRVRDTLLHEMCHAATWLVNGISDGHGPKWKSWAMKAIRIYPELPIVKRCHDYEIKTKYTYKCVKCGYSIGRHSKSLNTERKVCGYCYGKFELFVNKKNKDGVMKSTLVNDQKVNEFAQFVKENYGSIKRDNKVQHADVMRILGQKFSSLKVAGES